MIASATQAPIITAEHARILEFCQQHSFQCEFGSDAVGIEFVRIHYDSKRDNCTVSMKGNQTWNN